jgi:hypothetical protein
MDEVVKGIVAAQIEIPAIGHDLNSLRKNGGFLCIRPYAVISHSSAVLYSPLTKLNY